MKKIIGRLLIGASWNAGSPNNPQAVKADAIAAAPNCSANTFMAIQIAFQSYFYHDTQNTCFGLQFSGPTPYRL